MVICLINKTGDFFKAVLILYVLPVFLLFMAHKLYKGNKWVIALGGYFYMLMAISIIRRMEAVAVKNAHHYKETAITIDNNIIRSDSSFYYLGKTNNYVFFYDARNKSSIVYPRDKVTKVATTEKTPENCLPVFP